MKRRMLTVLITAIVSIVAIAGTFLRAQEFRGSILGRVTDPSGAVVPGASVTAVNEATNAKVEAVSNDEGNYAIPFLLPGRYTVTAELPGFKKSVRSGIILQVQDKITVDFALQVGEASESVTVSSESPLLQTANADLGQVVDRHFLDRLPISGQSPLNFVDLAPGVIGGSGGYTGNSQNDITINGGNGGNRGNDVTVDGIPNLSARQSGLAVTIPMADAVQEFRVSTTMFDASLGRSNGGSLALTTRGGTNEFHGSAYYDTRNRALNANSWTNNRLGISRPATKFHMGGGTFGGPVVIPKLYNGHDRTFFFFAYEQVQNVSQILRQARVPTALERLGDFSQSLSTSGPALRLFNPFSTVVDANGKFVSRAEFAGAKIPQNLLSPIGLAVLSQYPLPTFNLTRPQIGLDNWAGSTTLTLNTKNLQARVDQQLSSRQRLYARFSALRHFQEPTPNLFPGASNFPVGGNTDVNPDGRRNHSFSADDTITFSSTFVGSLRYGFTRTNIKVPDGSAGLDPALLKLPDIIIKNEVNVGWPVFNLQADGAPTIGGAIRRSANDIHAIFATFNKLQGAHSFKFGTDTRLLRWFEPNPGQQANGNFVFNNTLTRQDPTRSATGNTSGSAMASLLLGLPATGNSNMGPNASLALQSYYAGLFFQDDWKLGRRLTLNLGLRWEIETPFTERFDRLPYGFDPTAAVGITVPAVTLPTGEVVNLGALKGGLVFVNKDGLPRRQGKLDRNNFGPRIGLAYLIGKKTVVRAGYGMFFSSTAVNEGTPVALASFSAITPYQGSANGDTTVLPGVSLSNPFPNGLVQPTGSSLGPKTELGNNVNFLNQDMQMPYVQQWTLNVQRQLPWQTFLEVAYAGSHSIKILETWNLNELPDRFFNAANTQTSVSNPFKGPFPANSTLGQGDTIRIDRLRRLFPQFNNLNAIGLNTGRVGYDGLQVTMQKRLSNGLQFVGSYSLSRTMQYTGTSVINERHNTKSASATDFPNLFRLFATYDLPIGRGRTFGSNLPGWLDSVVGGWSGTWLTRYTSGPALTVNDTRGRPIPIRDPNLEGPIKGRLGDGPIDPATGFRTNPYLDPTAFMSLPNDFTVTPEPARYGWLRGPGTLQHGLTIFKTLHIVEKVSFELRGEINNIFNSPQFGIPATNLASKATFGVINSAGGNRTILLGGKVRF
ncbi:MAG TPA: carboxypeptidase-like regulatory domain-containing protein [Acidobacteriota bacterium]|nr:carboxypeptidase-like regulatory domain-containing protein [Acidobacteriota bacterium]